MDSSMWIYEDEYDYGFLDSYKTTVLLDDISVISVTKTNWIPTTPTDDSAETKIVSPEQSRDLNLPFELYGGCVDKDSIESDKSEVADVSDDDDDLFILSSLRMEEDHEMPLPFVGIVKDDEDNNRSDEDEYDEVDDDCNYFDVDFQVDTELLKSEAHSKNDKVDDSTSMMILHYDELQRCPSPISSYPAFGTAMSSEDDENTDDTFFYNCIKDEALQDFSDTNAGLLLKDEGELTNGIDEKDVGDLLYRSVSPDQSSATENRRSPYQHDDPQSKKRKHDPSSLSVVSWHSHSSSTARSSLGEVERGGGGGGSVASVNSADPEVEAFSFASSSLQEQLHRSFAQLSNSMRRSDITRQMIKRQRISTLFQQQHHHVGSMHPSFYAEQMRIQHFSFFSKSKQTILEQSRRQLYQTLVALPYNKSLPPQQY